MVFYLYLYIDHIEVSFFNWINNDISKSRTDTGMDNDLHLCF